MKLFYDTKKAYIDRVYGTTITDRSIILRGGGGLQNGRRRGGGGASEFLPLQRKRGGVGTQDFSHVGGVGRGGTTCFG